ncbi:MAG TPA: hypothetical protein VGA21_01280 [Cyclobacteriaceae bacterium]|jgi:hypothetical protein
MKPFRKLAFALLIILPGISIRAYSQDYSSAVGIRVGSTAGISVKHFINKTMSFEGQLESIWRGINIGGLVEFYTPAFSIPNFKFYGGFGGHFGSWRGYGNHPWFYEDRDYHSVVGVDGILGFEYTFDDIPLNIGIDWKPGFNIVEDAGPWVDNIGLSIRFVIK